MALLRNREVVADDGWNHLDDDAALPSDGDVTVSLERFARDRFALRDRSGRTGVRLQPDDDAEGLAGATDELALVVVTFPKFTDGRGYSTARLLRDRLGYRGELRAAGHVLPDQVFYMHRCGFDAFDLAEGKEPAHALAALGELSVTYQAAADDPRPLFRRRARA